MLEQLTVQIADSLQTQDHDCLSQVENRRSPGRSRRGQPYCRERFRRLATTVLRVVRLLYMVSSKVCQLPVLAPTPFVGTTRGYGSTAQPCGESSHHGEWLLAIGVRHAFGSCGRPRRCRDQAERSILRPFHAPPRKRPVPLSAASRNSAPKSKSLVGGLKRDLRRPRARGR
jgi:hypothetical protein